MKPFTRRQKQSSKDLDDEGGCKVLFPPAFCRSVISANDSQLSDITDLRAAGTETFENLASLMDQEDATLESMLKKDSIDKMFAAVPSPMSSSTFGDVEEATSSYDMRSIQLLNTHSIKQPDGTTREIIGFEDIVNDHEDDESESVETQEKESKMCSKDSLDGIMKPERDDMAATQESTCLWFVKFLGFIFLVTGVLVVVAALMHTSSKNAPNETITVPEAMNFTTTESPTSTMTGDPEDITKTQQVTNAPFSEGLMNHSTMIVDSTNSTFSPSMALSEPACHGIITINGNLTYTLQDIFQEPFPIDYFLAFKDVLTNVLKDWLHDEIESDFGSQIPLLIGDSIDCKTTSTFCESCGGYQVILTLPLELAIGFVECGPPIATFQDAIESFDFNELKFESNLEVSVSGASKQDSEKPFSDIQFTSLEMAYHEGGE